MEGRKAGRGRNWGNSTYENCGGPKSAWMRVETRAPQSVPCAGERWNGSRTWEAGKARDDGRSERRGRNGGAR